jgi:hypothetical protein
LATALKRHGIGDATHATNVMRQLDKADKHSNSRAQAVAAGCLPQIGYGLGVADLRE